MNRISAVVKDENKQTRSLDILSSFRMRLLRSYIVSFRFDYFREVEKKFNLPYGTFYMLYITFTALRDFLSRLGFMEDMFDNVICVQSMFSEFPEVAYVLAELFVSYIVVRRYHERYRLPLDIITCLFNGERTSINEISTVVDEILDRIRKNRLSISKEEIIDCVRTVRLSHMLRFLARLVELYGEDLLLLIIKLIQPPAIGVLFNKSILPRLNRLNIISSKRVKTDKKLLNYLLNTAIDNATAVEEAKIGIQALGRYLPVIEEKVGHLIDHIDNHVFLPRATMPSVKEHFNITDTYLRRIFTEYAAYYNRFVELAEKIINIAYTVVSKLTEDGEIYLC
ncbi:MAG: hypothetical protein GXO26_02740, partial [Crenarchaeota archaeon]|nr:hypothetical protein [Thermoproteota archaeon]